MNRLYRIKQNIFENTGGILQLLEILEKALNLFDYPIEINNQMNFEDVTQEILKLINLIFKILSFLCCKNKNIQQ